MIGAKGVGFSGNGFRVAGFGQDLEMQGVRGDGLQCLGFTDVQLGV